MAGATFDPNAPFEVVFDPNAPFEEIPMGAPVDMEPSGQFEKALGIAPAITRAAITAKLASIKQAYDAGGAGAAIAEAISPANVSGAESIKQLIETGEPKLAPTGKEQAAMLGFSPEERPVIPGSTIGFSPAGVVGTGLELLQDPTGIIAGGIKAVAEPLKLGEKAWEATKGLGKAAVTGTGLVAGKTAGALTGAFKEELGKTVESGIRTGARKLTELGPQIAEQAKGLVPKVRKEFLSEMELGQKYGIDPAVLSKSRELTYGPDAFVTKSRAVTRQLGNVSELEAFDAAQEQIQNAIQLAASKASGDMRPVGQMAAGEAIVSAYDNAIQQLFAQNEVRYSNIANQLKIAGPVSKEQAAKIQESTDSLLKRLQQIEVKANKEMQFSVDPNLRKQAAANKDAVARIAMSLEKNDVATTIEQMQQVGRDAFSRGSFFGTGEVGPDKKLLKTLYGDLKNVVTKNLETFNPQIAEELKKSNEALSKFFDQNKFIGEIVQNPKIPKEQVFSRIIASGDSNKIASLFSIIGNDETAKNVIRAQYLEGLASKTAEGMVSPISTLKNLQKDKARRITLLLFETPEQQQTFSDYEGLLKLAKNLGVKNINPSGSGLLMLAASPLETLKSQVGKNILESGLEAKAGQQYFATTPLSELLALKQQGKFAPQIIDPVIAERVASPEGALLQKQMAMPNLSQDMTKSTAKAVMDKAANESWDAVKAIISDAAGAVLVPQNPPHLVSKTMTVFRALYQQRGYDMPVMPAAADIPEIIKYIDASDANPILKARNKLNLQQTGYLLNPGQFAGAAPVSTLMLQETKKKQQEQKNLESAFKATKRPETEAEKPGK